MNCDILIVLVLLLFFMKPRSKNVVVAFFGPTGQPLPVVEGGVLLNPVTTVQATFPVTVNRARLMLKPTNGKPVTVLEQTGLSTNVVTFVWNVPAGTSGKVWVVGWRQCDGLTKCLESDKILVTTAT